jgi:hypothetical protein
VIYIDGLIFGDYTMIGAVGVDSEGNKHVLGIREGATENSTVITELLEDIVSRGVDPKRKMLFVIDGSKALRAAINAVFGSHQPVQRCRAHKLRNVLDYLPKDQRAQVKSVLRAAWKLGPERAWRDQKAGRMAGSTATPRRRPACWKAWRNALPSTGWIFRPLCIAAWRQPTSSRARTPVYASRPAALPTGRTAKWFCAGWPRRLSEPRSGSTKSWATAIYGPWKLSSTPLRPPAKRRRSNINLTAARHFQLRAGHAHTDISVCGLFGEFFSKRLLVALKPFTALANRILPR